jgi:hypothetical protein
VLDLNSLDLDEIASSLADQTDYDHLWLINPATDEVVLWTADTGVDGHNSVDLDELGLVGVRPLPSWEWYQDMADFADQITDEQAGQRLALAARGKGRLSSVQDELHEECPHLLRIWCAFRDARAKRRAVQWLADNSLIADERAQRFLTEHPFDAVTGGTARATGWHNLPTPDSVCVGAARRALGHPARSPDYADSQRRTHRAAA